MKLGANWSGQRELPVLQEVLSNVEVDFVELLIDNFLLTDPCSILKILDGRDCAFHIMNSQFLHKDTQALKVMAKLLQKLSKTLNPIYVSDHLGVFYFHGQALPQMLEVDYVHQKECIFQQTDIWQSILDCKLLLENYPSVTPQGQLQTEFYRDLIDQVECGLLFDISNAVVAERNVGEAKDSWLPLLANTQNYHIAGYEECTDGGFLVDTHNQCIDSVSLDFLAKISRTQNIKSISVERDGNFISNEWCIDISRTRAHL